MFPQPSLAAEMPLGPNENAGPAGKGYLQNANEPLILNVIEHLFDYSMRGEEHWHILSVIIQVVGISRMLHKMLELKIITFDGICYPPSL